MLFYHNQTRFDAILTLRIESGEDLKPTLKVGADNVYYELNAPVGYHDILVGSGREVHVINNAIIVFVSARSAS